MMMMWGGLPEFPLRGRPKKTVTLLRKLELMGSSTKHITARRSTSARVPSRKRGRRMQKQYQAALGVPPGLNGHKARWRIMNKN
eukprot:4091341-Pyramimonas_sp.AAC.1